MGTLWHDLCKNGWTDRDAVWFMDLGGPKEACIRWGPDPHVKGQLLGQRTCPGMPNDILLWAVQKLLNWLICDLYLGGQNKHKFNCIHQCAIMGGHIGATWRIQLNRPSVAAMRPWGQITLTTCYTNNTTTFIKQNWTQKQHWSIHDTQVVICLQRGADDLHMVQLMPLPPNHLLLH